MIKAGIVGVSGYGGAQLFHILSGHPEVEIVAISSQSYNGQMLGDVYPHLSHIDMLIKAYEPSEMADLCDVIFTAVPHGGPAMAFARPVKEAGKKLIDLSADFRLQDIAVYEEWYKVEHKEPALLKEAVYGLPEIKREQLKNAWLVACPGCYPTASILGSIPALKNDLIDPASIIIDAKSGVSGAGRKVKAHLHYPELENGFSAYGIAQHRHTPEIEQGLSEGAGTAVNVTFVPHLVPMVRGILAVAYASLVSKITEEDLIDYYKKFYQNEPFVRVLDKHLPNTKFVSGTNFIDVACRIDKHTNRAIFVSAIDNLMKGASSQAVQCMNIVFGLPETTGLYHLSPQFP